jgi:thiol-disulfide isomerase/thioredoxin
VTSARRRSSRPGWRKAALPLGLIAIVGLVAAALALGSGSNAKTPRALAARSNPPLTLRGTDVVTGKPVSLAASAGKPVVLNFWSSSCGACFADARALASFERTHPAARVLGVDVTDSTASAKSLYRRAGWRHPSIADPSGRIAAQLRLQTLPTTLFFDAQHRVIERINGQTTPAGFSAGYTKASA